MNINHIKIAFAALLGFLSSLLGVLALPVFLVVSCNIIDYITGLMAKRNILYVPVTGRT